MKPPPTDPREPYEPPSIEDVPVKPEEMVLAGCKTVTGPPNSGSFFSCGLLANCKSSSAS